MPEIKRKSLNLRVLLVMVICITGLSVIFQRVILQLILLLFSCFLIFLNGIEKKSLSKLLQRLLRIGRFILIIFVFQLLFRRTGNTLWQFAFLRITDTGLNYALASSLRFFLIILVAGLLLDIPFKNYLIALRSWKFPYEISFLVASTIHFLPVFHQVFKTKMEALQLRGIEFSKIHLSERLHILRLLLIPVIATAINDIRYRAISLELRAFRLFPERSALYENKLDSGEKGIIFLSLLLSLLIILLLKT